MIFSFFSPSSSLFSISPLPSTFSHPNFGLFFLITNLHSFTISKLLVIASSALSLLYFLFSHITTGMGRTATFRSSTDRIYDDGAIRLWYYNITVLTIVLQLPTVFSTETWCTVLQHRSNSPYGIDSISYSLGVAAGTQGCLPYHLHVQTVLKSASLKFLQL